MQRQRVTASSSHKHTPEVERAREFDPLPAGCSWYVARTNPRCEARAAGSIRGAGFTVYLPTLVREMRHRRSKKWIRRQFPLFVGYAFVALEVPGLVGQIRSCDGVRDVLRGTLGPVPVPAAFIEDLQSAQRAGRFDHLRPQTDHGFAKDDVVLIGKGPYADLVGTVMDAAGAELIKVMTELFNSVQEVTVHVDSLRHAA